MESKKIRWKLEYIWLDGCEPTQNLRSKTLVVDGFNGDPTTAPVWAFDGSSTNQARGGTSDLLLKPVFCVKDPIRKNSYLVMSEVLNADKTPHKTNWRAKIKDDSDDFWFGWE